MITLGPVPHPRMAGREPFPNQVIMISELRGIEQDLQAEGKTSSTKEDQGPHSGINLFPQ